MGAFVSRLFGCWIVIMPIRHVDGVARVSSVLPGAGAYDSSPIEIPCNEYQEVTFLLAYTRRAAGGAVTHKVEFSLDKTNWFQASGTKSGLLAAGSDCVDLIQRVEVSYQATGAAIERVVTDSYKILGYYFRLACKESGIVGTPGTVAASYHLKGNA